MLHGANVIKVRMGKNNSLNVTLSSAERGNIGDEIIDTQHIFVGKLQPQINDVERGIDFHDKTIPPYLFKPPQREHAHAALTTADRRRNVRRRWEE